MADQEHEAMPKMATVTVDILSFPEGGMRSAYRIAVTTQTGTVYWVPDLSRIADPDLPKNRLARAAFELVLDAWSMIG